MNASLSVRQRLHFFIAMLVAIGLMVVVMYLPGDYFQRRAAPPSTLSQGFVDAIQRGGGVVLFSPTDPSSVVSVALRDLVINAELREALSQCTGIERLTLDGASLQPNDCELLDRFPKLSVLSLARSNITDAHIACLPLGIVNLSLNDTSITDASMPHVATMSSLVNLDLTNTEITSEGLQELEPLTSLEKLWVEDTCITTESVQALRRMQPASVDVVVMEGNGKRAYELLTGSKDFKSRGNFRKGYTLWESDQDWGLTLAGVAEAVVAEADLNSEQAARLRDALTSVIDFKSTKVVLPLVFTYSTSGSPAAGSQIGIEIESAEEFLEVLLEERSTGVITQSLVQYVRERFTASDVPKLLAALDSTPYPSDKRGSAQRLFNVAPFLLVHWGEGLPQVEAELERLLLHPAGFVRMTTVCAFGYGGARPFYSREEWMPSEAVDAFAVRKLLPICKGEGQGYQSRGEAWCVLAEIVHRRPEYAEQVVPVLIDVLGDASVLSNYKFGDYFLKLGEVAPEVVVAGVPKLRALLESLDVQYFSDPEAESAAPNWEHRGHCKVVLASLSAAASQSPELSEEVAIQYLERMGQGQLMGPFAPLLSPDRPAITKRVIEALLDSPDVAKDELEPVVKTIRDWKEA